MFTIKKAFILFQFLLFISCGSNTSPLPQNNKPKGLFIDQTRVFHWESFEIENGALPFSVTLPFVSFNGQDLFPGMNTPMFGDKQLFDMFHNTCDPGRPLLSIQNWYKRVSQSSTPWEPQRDIRKLPSCQLRRYLDCVFGQLQKQEAIFSRLSGQNVSYRARKELLATGVLAFKACRASAQLRLRDGDLGGVHPDLPDYAPAFALTQGQITFQPSPLSYIAIYENSWTTYDEALVTSAPVASVPLEAGCQEPNGACLESPLPVSRCLGCSALKPRSLYTAFLVRGPKQPEIQIMAVVFRAQ